mgnify:FL=1
MSHFRMLPSITEADAFLKSRSLPAGLEVREQVDAFLAQARQTLALAQEAPWLSKQEVLETLADEFVQTSTRAPDRVINATGVVVHTNLGRAPLAAELFQSVQNRLCAYSPLEFDLKSGERGERGERVQSLLRALSGAEAGTAVNNNAAAVFLMLRALAAGKEVLVSRGELVEIGGSFRIPDILREAGVTLVEVGTTNRTRLSDYEQAITENTAALLKVNPSNYEMRGFTAEVTLPELANLAHQHNLTALYDWGSGSFYRFAQGPLLGHPTATQVLDSGVDVIAFSGDKLLGGVQAGLILGRATLVQQLRKHPLYRALRLDKGTLALLEETLAAYLDPTHVPERIPTVRMLEESKDEIRTRAEYTLARLKLSQDSCFTCELRETESLAGGGALPELTLPSLALVLKHTEQSAQQLQTRLRGAPVPVIARIQDECVWLDFRTVLPGEFADLADALNALCLQK